MSLKLTKDDIGRKVKTVNGKTGILQNNGSFSVFPFKVTFEKSLLQFQTYTINGTVYSSNTLCPDDLVEFVDENPATISEAIPNARFKVGDLVTFLAPGEGGVMRKDGSLTQFYHGGICLKGTVGKVREIYNYNSHAKCFDISVTFKQSDGNTSYEMLEKEFEEYHKPKGETFHLTMFEEAGKFPIKTYEQTTQKNQIIDYETFRLPQAVIRGQEIHGNQTPSRTTPASVAIGHLGHRACSAY